MNVARAAVPARDECVLRYVLERRAAEFPTHDFIRLPSGESISYGEFLTTVRRTAAGLASLGVRQGDTVTVWLPNGLEMVRVWFAINWLGAVYVPINTAYKGGLLAHVLANAGSKVIVASASLAPRLIEVDCATLERVVLIGGEGGPIGQLEVRGTEALDANPEALPPLERAIEPWDVQSIIYTSGTTGRSKGVISSYAHLFSMSGERAWPMWDSSDTFLLYGPLFHVAGTLPVVGSLNRGGIVAIGGDFSTEGFWPTVRATRSTIVILLGVMTSFLEKRPPAPDDRDHPLKKAIMIPLPDSWQAFSNRFGMTVWTMFNMTETNCPILSEPNPAVLGTCGKLRSGIDARIVDENDCEVGPGKVGELILRTESPWELNSGYFKDLEATARAWRNGWFHTGDGFRKDDGGNYFFVDRMKDAIRRRGENISSFEVELEILAHPDVRECAVLAVPNDMAEDDVLAVLAPVPGRTIDPEQLLDFLQSRMAHFMLPRYIRLLEDLPRTPTQKVEKHVLRSAGLTSDTWDREKAGVKVVREKLRG